MDYYFHHCDLAKNINDARTRFLCFRLTFTYAYDIRYFYFPIRHDWPVVHARGFPA